MGWVAKKTKQANQSTVIHSLPLYCETYLPIQPPAHLPACPRDHPPFGLSACTPINPITQPLAHLLAHLTEYLLTCPIYTEWAKVGL